MPEKDKEAIDAFLAAGGNQVEHWSGTTSTLIEGPMQSG